MATTREIQMALSLNEAKLLIAALTRSRLGQDELPYQDCAPMTASQIAEASEDLRQRLLWCVKADDEFLKSSIAREYLNETL